MDLGTSLSHAGTGIFRDQLQGIQGPASVRAAAECLCVRLQWGSKRLTGAGLLLQQITNSATIVQMNVLLQCMIYKQSAFRAQLKTRKLVDIQTLHAVTAFERLQACQRHVYALRIVSKHDDCHLLCVTPHT